MTPITKTVTIKALNKDASFHIIAPDLGISTEQKMVGGQVLSYVDDTLTGNLQQGLPRPLKASRFSFSFETTDNLESKAVDYVNANLDSIVNNNQ